MNSVQNINQSLNNSQFKKFAVPEKMLKDAFAAISISIFKEWFLSSDTKFLIFSGMIENLKLMGYSKKDIKTFKNAFNEAIKYFNQQNDFMG